MVQPPTFTDNPAAVLQQAVGDRYAFRLLGTPAADKKHVAYPASHFIPQTENVRETLALFDKYPGRP